MIRRYDVLNSSPRSISLEMLRPVRYTASLREAAYDVDPDTKNPHVRGGWVSMSASGDVTAPIVYAHGGNPEDYDVLQKARHRRARQDRARALLEPVQLPRLQGATAERHGAAGLLIYSDPAEDGYRPEYAFPNGPRGPETHIQRGSITYDFIVPGRPADAGLGVGRRRAAAEPEAGAVAAEDHGHRISWHDAQPLLEHMGGPAAPAGWQGGLPITYRLGGEAIVHFKADMDTSVQPIYVVEARITGAELPGRMGGARQPPRRLGVSVPSTRRAARRRCSACRTRSASCCAAACARAAR